VLDLEIERSERRDVHEGYFDEFAYSVRGQYHEAEHGSPSEHDGGRLRRTVSEDRARELERYLDQQGAMANNPINPLMPDVKNFGEMFVFSYGVVVFWNFTEHQEKDILADLTFAENETGTSLLTRPLEQSDFETEEFHFEYSSNLKRPRVFNDMITLLPRSDHMVKLTISHDIAQSTKLCFFEERMSETMQDAQHVPKRLALTGELNMTRTEIVKLLGGLFKSRVDINLCMFSRSLALPPLIPTLANRQQHQISSTYRTSSGTRSPISHPYTEPSGSTSRSTAAPRCSTSAAASSSTWPRYCPTASRT
jgi:uncharacterized Rmd1/YagE family protein